MSTRIDLEIGDGLATVTLHNPAQLNAVNATMWRGLSAAMAQIAGDDSVRCVIVRGAGDEAFAAGGDIEEFPAFRFEPDTVRDFSAACFYFARELQKTVDVPMGLIQAAWGGSRIEAWTSTDALRMQGGMGPALDVLALSARDPAAANTRWGQHWQHWWTTREGAAADTPWQPGTDSSGWQRAPATLGAWERWGVPALAGYNGMVWYRTQVTLSADQAAKRAQLELGPIDETDMTWVNGVAVGSQYGAGERRTYALPPGLLKAGANTVVINVLDTYGEGGLAGPASAHAIRLDDGTRIALDARWQYRVAPGVQTPPLAPWHAATGLSTLYNGMISPLGAYGLRGVLWYQGESNTGDAMAYLARLRSLRDDWRGRFGAHTPLLLVQLAGYGQPAVAPVESGWAQVREAQRLAAAEDPRTGLAVAIDIGDKHDRGGNDVYLSHDLEDIMTVLEGRAAVAREVAAASAPVRQHVAQAAATLLQMPAFHNALPGLLSDPEREPTVKARLTQIARLKKD